MICVGFLPCALFNHQPPSVSDLSREDLQVQVCRQPALPLPHPDLTSLPAAGPLGTQPASDGTPEVGWR